MVDNRQGPRYSEEAIHTYTSELCLQGLTNRRGPSDHI